MSVTGEFASSTVRTRSSRIVAAKTAGLLLATFVLVHGGPYTASAQAAAACAGVANDFNGDGVRDIAVAAPEASVAGKERAGLVRVVLGGGKGVVEISQETPNVADSAEAGDGFGTSLATYDADLDGCTDLAVGVPYEDVGTVRDAGYVQVIFGSAGSVGQDQESRGFVQGAASPIGGTPGQEDWMGYALAAGKSVTGYPFLAIGVPGDDIGSDTDAGSLAYVWATGFNSVSVTQDSIGVWEDSEPYDRFGSSVAATDRHFAVGAPGESIGTVTGAGGLQVFVPSINTDGIPKPLFGIGQGRTPGPDPAAQVDDRYATALAMAPYRPAGASTTTDSLLAVGVPGEDLSTTVDAGAVHVFHVTAAGTITLLNWIDQNTGDVGDSAEAGDSFGQRLAAVNTATGVVGTSATMRLAVGSPGEDVGDLQDQGVVQNVPMIGPPGASDKWIASGSGLPGEPAARAFTGMSLGSTPSLLYVGTPYGPAATRAVHGFAWTGAEGAAPVQSWRPGEGGVPAGDGAFGAVIR